MRTALVLSGVGCLIVSGTVALALTGRVKALAPFIAAAVGLVLIVVGIGYRAPDPPRSGAAPVPSRALSPAPSLSPVLSSTPPAPPSSAPQVANSGCASFTPGSAPGSPPPSYQGPNLPAALPGDAQALPGEFAPGRPAGGTLVPSRSLPPGLSMLDPWTTAAVAPALTDLTAAGYDDLSLSDMGGVPFLRLIVGTPKAGTCWNELADTALTRYFGSGHVFNARSEPAGPRLAEYHAVLLCAESSEALNICSWAGPGRAGGRPVFGLLTVAAIQKVVQGGLDDEVMTAFSEKVFEAATAA